MFRLFNKKTHPVSRLIFLILFYFLPISIWSQEIHTDVYAAFTNLNHSNGLSNSVVNDIYQDIYGYIWIATDDGLNRFDGNKFIVFKNIIHDSTSISNNFITSITGDTKGNIWVGTSNGLNRYNREAGTFKRFKSSPFLPHTLRSNHVRKILLQSDSTLWIETIDGTLSRFEINTGKFEHFSHKAIAQADYKYHALWGDDNGDIWVGGRDIDILIFDTEKKMFRKISTDPKNPNKKKDNELADVLKTSKDKYYVAANDGFYSFNPKNETFKKLNAVSTFSLDELHNGNILMGTGHGLFVYNPKENTFIRYINDADYPKSLINNHINKVLLDKSGNIWVGTNEGISILQKIKSGINNYFHIPENSKSLSSNKISSILQDSKNRIWIGTKDQGLNLWNTKTNTFKHFKNDPKNPKSISSNNISKIYEDKDGDMWIGLWSGIGFNKFTPDNEKFTRYAIHKNSHEFDWYNDILEDSRGNLWLGVWGGNGFQRFDKKTEKFLTHYNSRHIPINLLINNIIYDGADNLFIQTDLPIIHIYNPKSKLFTAYVSPTRFLMDTISYKYASADLPLHPNKTFSIVTNSKGLTLIASDAGLMAYQASKRAFSKIDTKGLIPNNLIYNQKQNAFYAFAENKILKLSDQLKVVSINPIPIKFGELGKLEMKCGENGNIWVLSEKGVFQFSPENNNWEEIDFGDLEYTFEKTKIMPVNGEVFISSNKGLWRADINDISKHRQIEVSGDSHFLNNINYLSKFDNDNLVVVSVYGIGILNLNTNEIEYIDIKYTPSDFGFNVNGAVAINNKLFLSSSRDVFELDLNLKKKQLKKINQRDKLMVSSRLTTCLSEDNIGNIWIGTTNKGLNRLNTKTEVFNHYLMNDASTFTPENEIICIHPESENTIWLGTDKGLYSLNTLSENFKLHSENWGVNRIESILSISDSILWLGTDKGLIRYNTYTLKHQIFLESDGLPTLSFNKGAYLLNNGQVIMATDLGIITFDPDKLIISNSTQKTEITAFNLFDEPFNLNIQSGDTIDLSYKNNFFSIDFSTMNFNAPNSGQYSYNISGMGEKWISTNTASANFTNLPAGEYIFKVCQKGNENNEEYQAKLAIHISPPFWKTVWFWVLNFILIGGVAVIFLIGYIRQIKISERNTLLEQKLLTSQMNPHFVFNSLSAIQSFIYKNEAEVAGNYLSDFSSLMRLILENSRSEMISLENEIKTLHLYINLQQLRFSNKFDYNITIDPKLDIKAISIPPMLAQPFIENSIEHGIMHLKNKGNISIHFGLKQQSITIEVIDDGIGLKQSKFINLKRETHTSFATSITYERLTNLTRAGNKNIGIIVSDRFDKEGVNGTRVNLDVPFNTIKKKNKFDKNT